MSVPPASLISTSEPFQTSYSQHVSCTSFVSPAHNSVCHCHAFPGPLHGMLHPPCQCRGNTYILPSSWRRRWQGSHTEAMSIRAKNSMRSRPPQAVRNSLWQKVRRRSIINQKSSELGIKCHRNPWQILYSTAVVDEKFINVPHGVNWHVPTPPTLDRHYSTKHSHIN